MWPPAQSVPHSSAGTGSVTASSATLPRASTVCVTRSGGHSPAPAVTHARSPRRQGSGGSLSVLNSEAAAAQHLTPLAQARFGSRTWSAAEGHATSPSLTGGRQTPAPGLSMERAGSAVISWQPPAPGTARGLSRSPSPLPGTLTSARCRIAQQPGQASLLSGHISPRRVDTMARHSSPNQRRLEPTAMSMSQSRIAAGTAHMQPRP